MPVILPRAPFHLLGPIKAFSAPHVFNPWTDVDPEDDLRGRGGPEFRAERLMQHFRCAPDFLLVGEAPGYRGCRISGVPFTSEAQLCEGVDQRLLLEVCLTTHARPWREASATVVWRALHDLKIAERTVLWNAFAWHPHRPGNPRSNRTPSEPELRVGAPVLEEVLRHFEGATVVAVGRRAAAALGFVAPRPFREVRHPANGGAQLFREGLRQLVHARPVPSF